MAKAQTQNHDNSIRQETPMLKHLRPVHPFPARMAPELVWDELPERSSYPLRVLDPMAGSGTTLAAAKLRGYEVIGYDRDPLAVLITRAWLSNVDIQRIETRASQLVRQARATARHLRLSQAYPRLADEETRAFVRYWFDDTNRIQLTALSDAISRIRERPIRDVMWCAFSRLIITKQSGVSRAMDISHSRPHRAYEKAPIKAFERFQWAARQVARGVQSLKSARHTPRATIDLADARNLPIRSASVDVVITSPPYLNAIDYLRGHKFSLVWMGYNIEVLRTLRATNVGTEAGANAGMHNASADRILSLMCSTVGLRSRHAGMLGQYVLDMRHVLSEIKRVLRKGGKAIIVVGNSSLKDTFVRNSSGVQALAVELGMHVIGSRTRRLPEGRRYLPPPGSPRAGVALKKRLRQEVILTLVK